MTTRKCLWDDSLHCDTLVHGQRLCPTCKCDLHLFGTRNIGVIKDNIVIVQCHKLLFANSSNHQTCKIIRGEFSFQKCPVKSYFSC